MTDHPVVDKPVVTDRILSARDITVRFGGVTAVNNVSFDVVPGEFFAIIGPNGAGKTTLLNALSGLVKSSGEISLLGEPISGVRSDIISRRGLGRTFQNLGLFSTMTVLENVLVGSQDRLRAGMPSSLLWWGKARREEVAVRTHAYEILDLVGLADIAHEQVSNLPYGTRKRVELAKAAAGSPKVLLLDEPVAGMNREETQELVHHVFDLKDQLDLTLVMIEHDVHLIMDVADRVLALDFGQAIGLGTPADIQTNPRVVEAYLGVDSETTINTESMAVPSVVRPQGSKR
ncbi:ABC transporter [Microbacterium sp. CH12i]|uniref:ABC transporter ATP-binding protein n=1 Tax=Microbacterium sp. CH12i TaxID=1479651 RepID=UPI000461DCD3|nr:ABC transporter ATP-binding protein [Microbacterium sp. CH12i]KDA05324.1 ABC transporter [Microbacterium sp. CH12i]